MGGIRGKKLLLATPLLRWYIQSGLNVTHVYQSIEYEPNACFKNFVKEISDARREGDRDPDTAIIADTIKLLGNSSKGSMITNKEKHCEIKYTSSLKEVFVNLPQFKTLDRLENIYEVQLLKTKINLDTPLQIGYFILQMAKLRMLSFYYDCIIRYIEKTIFEYIEMDMDSAYFAIAGRSLEEVVKPSKKMSLQI